MPNEPGPEEKSRVLLETAFILHRQPYRETSLLVDAFAASRGRLRLLAKGAQRGPSARSHLLRPFVPLRLSWSGRGELPTLTAAEAEGGAVPLAGTALYCGLYLNELLLRLLPLRDPYPEAFALYQDALRRLAETRLWEAALRRFEVGLLEQLGYGLCLEREGGSGRAVDPAKTYDYVIDRGPVAAEAAGADSLRGSTLLALSRDRLEAPEALREAKRLLRRVIHHYLDGRALRSRDLFKQPRPTPSA
jgi:DNA repair protein RecO (recombination protein O)